MSGELGRARIRGRSGVGIGERRMPRTPPVGVSWASRSIAAASAPAASATLVRSSTESTKSGAAASTRCVVSARCAARTFTSRSASGAHGVVADGRQSSSRSPRRHRSATLSACSAIRSCGTGPDAISSRNVFAVEDAVASAAATVGSNSTDAVSDASAVALASNCCERFLDGRTRGGGECEAVEPIDELDRRHHDPGVAGRDTQLRRRREFVLDPQRAEHRSEQDREDHDRRDFPSQRPAFERCPRHGRMRMFDDGRTIGLHAVPPSAGSIDVQVENPTARDGRAVITVVHRRDERQLPRRLPKNRR